MIARPLLAGPRGAGEALPLVPFQRDALDAVFARYAAGVKRQIVSIPTGGGKCLGLGTPVLRHDGRIVPVEDVEPGDLLMGPDSTARRVLSIARGRGQLYRIVPVKGEPWVCNDVHVLTLVETVTGRVVDVDLPEYLQSSQAFRHTHKQFAPPKGVDFEPVQRLPINPYFLGVWLGDGAKRLDRVCISKPDEEIREAVAGEAWRWGLLVREDRSKRCPSYYIHGKRGAGNPLLKELRRLFSDGWTIPHEYLTASRAERAALLAGLIDTDGYNHNNSCEIVQKIVPIADGIVFLARSLGFRVLRSEKMVNGEAYQRLSISGDLSQLPIRIARKRGSTRQQKKCVTRTGFEVEPIGVGEYAGFELDGDGRFLMGDFTVTHNTVLACHIIDKWGGPAVFMCHREELVQQTAEKLARFDPGLSVAICKADQGRHAWELRGADVVIASTQTLAREKRLGVLIEAVGTGGLLIVDECFPAGTLIDGRPIEDVAVGDTVRAFDHAIGRVTEARVSRLYRRKPSGLVRVWLASGRALVCTPEHPFYDVGAGAYRAARALAAGTRVLTAIEEGLHARAPLLDVSALRNRKASGARPALHSLPGRGKTGSHRQASNRGSLHQLRRAAHARARGGDGIPHDRACVLLEGVHGPVGERAQERSDGRDEPQVRLSADEGTQSHAPARGAGRAGREDAGARLAEGRHERRERPFDSASATTGGGTRVGDGGRRVDGAASPGPAHGVQVGHCRAEPADRDRGGRPITQDGVAPGRRRAEDCLPGIDRVDRVEVLEPGSDGRFGGLCPDGQVYNFEVEGLHNYFANGVLVHNCHHSMAGTWERAVRELAARLTVGLTATPKRGDGIGLDGLWEEISYSIPLRTLVEVVQPPMLARPVGIRIGTGVDLDAIRTRGGEFVESDLAIVCNTSERNSLVVDAWETHARGRAATVAFCVDVAHVDALSAAFRARGHHAAAVVGTTPAEERRRIYADFRRSAAARENPVLVSCLVLTEGWDEPLADTALMCRPTQSQPLYVQMAGRVLRRAQGKTDGLILDFVDATRRHQLQTIWALTGAERRDAEHAEREEADGVEQDIFAAVGAGQARQARVRESSERLGDLLSASRFVWHGDGADNPFAPIGQSEWLAVVREGDGFLPVRVFSPREGKPGYERLFSRPVDVDTAMLIAEQRIPASKLTDRSAEWRQREEPATEGQARAAAFLRLRLPDGCTKAQASELLDRGFFERAARMAGLTTKRRERS